MDHLSSKSSSGDGLGFSPNAIETADAIAFPSRYTMVKIMVWRCAREQREDTYNITYTAVIRDVCCSFNGGLPFRGKALEGGPRKPRGDVSD